MAGQYATFLQAPQTSLLAADASLVYITTTTEIKEPNAIIKHIQAQQKLVDKKGEKILNTISAPDGVCLETETTLQFKMGGGAYLPGMDDNLLDEKLVTFPLTHIVRYDEAGKIKQIRLYWDQGTLLKQVEAIGKTGRNWPIKDGAAQLQSIKKSLSAGGSNTDMNAFAATGQKSDVVINQHKRGESITATRDPHASLNLFQSRDPNEGGPRKFDGPVTAPRETYKGVSRDLAEIVGDENAQPGSKPRDPSPSKNEGFYPKAGAGKHQNPNRLFETEQNSEAPPQTERRKVFQGKNNHFEFGDGEDAPQERPMNSKGGKHNTQIDFAAFSVSPTVKGKTRPDYDRQWGPGVQEDDPPSPVKRPIVHKQRPDADSHFALADESPAPEAQQKSHARSQGMGLYQDPLNEDDSRTAINKSSNSRTNNFEPHYSMADASPADGFKARNEAKSNAGRNDMESSWDFGTPVKENRAIYKTAGNGMGGRRDEGRLWGIGDESDPESQDGPGGAMRGRRGKQARAGVQGHAGY
ncbi:hypothetical protein LTR62_005046 [Meristemomyces frigidus]|uniref:Uncharacterized protein n=1 Tax=Meristemomyces frigidus TaxID=1508187 RepID=A0AAN7TPM1_9PEZI|nr:hypothetical protein LTR62_005046 [Meristemomyces frigidus]